MKPLLSLPILAALVSVPAPVAAAAETCPAVAVVAARGSDQNAEEGEYLGPQTYGGRTSNGYEGRNFIDFFRFVEARHPGTMSRVQVLGLDDASYPAAMRIPPLAREGETLTLEQTSSRAVDIATHHSIPQLAYNATFGALESIKTGQRNAPGFVDAWEAATGCRPDYIVAGYSQGAIVGTSLEGHLARSGRLRGALYIGNPLQRPAGMAQWLPNSPAPLPADRRINYCLDGDFACALTVPNALAALQSKAKLHASYFAAAAQGAPSAEDAAVADSFASWVNNSISKP